MITAGLNLEEIVLVSVHHGGGDRYGGCGSDLWLGSGKVGQLVFTFLYRSGRSELRQEPEVDVTYHRVSKRAPSDPLLLEIPQVSEPPQAPKAAMPAGHHVPRQSRGEHVAFKHNSDIRC